MRGFAVLRSTVGCTTSRLSRIKNLYNCSANPTNLTITRLWTQPNEASDCLGPEEDEEPEPG